MFCRDYTYASYDNIPTQIRHSGNFHCVVTNPSSLSRCFYKKKFVLDLKFYSPFDKSRNAEEQFFFQLWLIFSTRNFRELYTILTVDNNENSYFRQCIIDQVFSDPYISNDIITANNGVHSLSDLYENLCEEYNFDEKLIANLKCQLVEWSNDKLFHVNDSPTDMLIAENSNLLCLPLNPNSSEEEILHKIKNLYIIPPVEQFHLDEIQQDIYNQIKLTSNENCNQLIKLISGPGGI